MKFAIMGFMCLLSAIGLHGAVITGQYVECREIPRDSVQICYHDSTTFGAFTGGLNLLDTMILRIREVDNTTVHYGIPNGYVVLDRDSTAGQYMLWNTYNGIIETMTVGADGNIEIFVGLRHTYLMPSVPKHFRKNKVFYSDWTEYYETWEKRLFKK